MKTSEIRDKLLEERTLYQQSLRESAEAAKKIQGILDSITDEDCELLQSIGIDCTKIRFMNLEKVKCNSEYLNACQLELNSVINSLHSYLEASLGV